MLDTLSNKPHEREALLFVSAVRALGAFGYSDLTYDIGGKKARRRYVSGNSPRDERCIIWIKSAQNWHTLAQAIRFPWKKIKDAVDGQQVVHAACDAAARRGATHLLAIVGDDQTGSLSFARLYPLTQVPALVGAQSELCSSAFYRAHGATLIVEGGSPDFAKAAEVARTSGEDILKPHLADSGSLPKSTQRLIRKTYARNPNVRKQALTISDGRCECCGELGFICESGERYLETHHVVGVAERGPDSIENVIAVCPKCHRMAHFSADRIQVERKMLEAIRRRGRRV